MIASCACAGLGFEPAEAAVTSNNAVPGTTRSFGYLGLRPAAVQASSVSVTRPTCDNTFSLGFTIAGQNGTTDQYVWESSIAPAGDFQGPFFVPPSDPYSATQTINLLEGEGTLPTTSTSITMQLWDSTTNMLLASANTTLPACSAGGGGTGGGGGAATGTANVSRLAGSDRFATAVAISQAEFPSGGASAVVLARGDNYPDALVGAPLAAAKDAPLLLTSGDTLPSSTSAEIQRVLAPAGTVYLLGGLASIPDTVATELGGLGYHVVRYAGATRYATAVQVADALGDPSTVLLASGINFPDALSAGTAAAKVGGAVFLTDGNAMPTETGSYLSAHATTVYAIGGAADAADPAATPLVGADRYATSVAVATQFFSSPTTVGIASGDTFPDALAGGAFLAHLGAPLVLSAATELPTPVGSYLSSVKGTVTSADLFGGNIALSTSVQGAVQTALGM